MDELQQDLETLAEKYRHRGLVGGAVAIILYTIKGALHSGAIFQLKDEMAEYAKYQISVSQEALRQAGAPEQL